MSTLTLINSLPVVTTLSLTGSQILINEVSTNNTLSRMTVGNFASQFLPTGPLISNAGGTATALDLDPLLTISAVGTDGLGTLTFTHLSAGQLLGNPTGASGPVEAAGISAFLDDLGSVEGDILYRGISGWQALAAGTAGQFLQTDATAGPPVWASASGAIDVTDGTHSVNPATTLDFIGATVSGTAPNATITITGGGSSSLLVEDGTHTVTAVSEFILSNGITLAASGTGTATLGVNSGPGDGFPVILHGYSGDGTLAASGTCLVADPPAGYTYSFGTSCLSIKVGSAPTNNVTLTLANGGSTVGSVVVPASSTTPTITITGTFNVTSEILLSGPATPDATFGKVRSTMIGTR